MKLRIPIGFKIAALVFIMLFAVAEFFTRYFKNIYAEDFKRNTQENLMNNAKIIASNINADEHDLAVMHDSLAYYNKIKVYLEKIRQSINFKEEIFTVFLHDEATSCFGVKSNTENIARQACSFRDSSLIPVFKKSFKEAKPIYSDIYEDRANIWISGFAPIINKDNKVVAVVELDVTFNEYNAKLNEITATINNLRLIGFVLSVLLGILIGYIFGKPISKISQGMKQVSNQEFSKQFIVSRFSRMFSDETVDLMDSFNLMSKKLNNALSELVRANHKLTELDHSKSVFLDLVAHELRTPITGLGFIDYLNQHHKFGEIEEEIISSLNESYQRIKSFTNSAEEYIRALNHNPTVDENCELLEHFSQSISEIILKSSPRKINVNVKSSDKNPIIFVDSEIFLRVISIIAENSIKFSKENSIIEIISENYEDYSIIRFKDYGKGIKKENLERVFDPYFVDDIASHSQGKGVNLAIARTLIRKYNGDIEAFSEGIDKGAEFVLKLKHNV